MNTPDPHLNNNSNQSAKTNSSGMNQSKMDETKGSFKNYSASEKKTDSSNYSKNSCPFSSFSSFTFSNKEQTATYLLLALGLLLVLFFNPLVGGLVLGGVAGFFFSKEIVYYLRNLTQIASNHEKLRYIVLTALLVGLFIAAPGFFLGALIVGLFKEVFAKQ